LPGELNKAKVQEDGPQFSFVGSRGAASGRHLSNPTFVLCNVTPITYETLQLF